MEQETQNGRRINVISDRDHARSRYRIYLGDSIPKSVAFKELIDNELDVVNESSQPATQAEMWVAQDSIMCMDNGRGISTEKHSDEYQDTNLWLAIGKLHTTSNDGGVSETVGANGVGLSLANFCSVDFAAARIVSSGRGAARTQMAYGYLTKDGELAEDFALNGIEASDLLKKLGLPSTVKLPFDSGFFTFGRYDNSVLPDTPDVKWLFDYTRLRASELGGNAKVITYKGYLQDGFAGDASYQDTWYRGSDQWLARVGKSRTESWVERIEKNDHAFLHKSRMNGFRFAFFDSPIPQDSDIVPIVQGAPVDNPQKMSYSFEFNGEKFSVQVPFSFYYVSTDYPPYNGEVQTKRTIRSPFMEARSIFARMEGTEGEGGRIFEVYRKKAELDYLKSLEKNVSQTSWYPPIGPADQAELIIAEGMSAIGGIKSERDPATQGCIGLRGKFLNVWNRNKEACLRSEVVAQIMGVLAANDFKRVILAGDEDEDGRAIVVLLLALITKFRPEMIKDGKVAVVKTPHFIFKKRGASEQWSDDPRDCPPGYTVDTIKGLGGLSPEQIRNFITDPSTRTLINITWDDEDDAAVQSAFDKTLGDGGKQWVVV